ncbi:MAG TPA: ThiF family adenylyltransferase [Pyrinomonadaceae bacterium]|jgi:molybdopterin/thiamine biosynthesis adenylyltransferase
MPNFSEKLSELYLNALKLVEAEVLTKLGALELTTDDLENKYGSKNVVKGWNFDLLTSRGLVSFNFLIKSTFPLEAPLIALNVPPKPLTFPHIEDDGILCLPRVVDCITRPVETVKKLISDSLNLLEDGFTKSNFNDFREEFDSYWLRTWSGGTQNFFSLLEPIKKSRIVSTLNSDKVIIVGEDDSSLQAWIEKYRIKGSMPLNKGGLLWLPEIPLPELYPKVNADLLILAKGSPDSLQVLDELSKDFPNSVPLIIASNSNDGLTMGGIVAHRTKVPISSFIKKAQNLNHGFRAGYVPAWVRRNRYWFNGTPVDRGKVTRADRQWIHSRQDSEIVKGVSEAKLVLIGCGSIGGFLAKLLASCGVGSITLIDSELLTWPNISRHFLGGRNVDKAKAESLADELQQDYPHLSFDYRNQRWQDAFNKEPDLFSTADLIISTTGDWQSEIALNLWQRTTETPAPIIYGWMEPFAIVGHSLAVFSEGRCFNCGFDDYGMFKFRATDWKTTTLKKEPACYNIPTLWGN